MANTASMPLLLQDRLFSCPRCGPLGSARLLRTGSRSNPLAGRCNRCEHSYQFTVGAPSTTTTGANSAGATTLSVASGSAFTSGSWVVIDAASATSAEIVKATAAGGSTMIPVTALALTHAGGATVQTGTLVPLGSLT